VVRERKELVTMLVTDQTKVEFEEGIPMKEDNYKSVIKNLHEKRRHAFSRKDLLEKVQSLLAPYP
jgi:hypothetical protein